MRLRFFPLRPRGSPPVLARLTGQRVQVGLGKVADNLAIGMSGERHARDDIITG